MAEVGEMLKGNFGGADVVENDVGYAADFIMSRYGDDGDGERKRPGSVDGDEAVDGALDEEARIFVDEISAMAVADDEIKVSFLQEKILDAAHDRGGIAVADLRDNDADGEAVPGTQGAGEEIGAILKFAGGDEDAILRLLRNGIGDGRAIDDQRNGGGRKGEVLREFLQAQGF